MLDRVAYLLPHCCGPNVGSQFLWRTKWKTQQPLCLNCDDEDCQWVVCNHSIAEIDTLFLLSTCSRDAFPLHSSCIGPDTEENGLQLPLNHEFGALSFVLFFPDTIDAVEYMCELCSNASLSLTEAHAAEELNDYCSLESPTQTCHSGCPDVPVCCYLLTPFL